MDWAECFKTKMKNNRVVAGIVLLTAIIIGISQLTDAIAKIVSFSGKHIEPLFTQELSYKFDNDLIKLNGGDGSSAKNAILIIGASTTDAGVAAEYFWLSKKYPGYKLIKQSTYPETPKRVFVTIDNHSEKREFTVLTPDKALKQYDLITIKKGESEIEVHFDITSFFGKPIQDPLILEVLKSIKDY